MKTKSLNWPAMSAEERDALVAEKVMGWTRLESPLIKFKGVAFTIHTHEKILLRLTNETNRMEPWPVTTSIAAAFEVVQRMRELKDCRCQIEERHTEWRVSFVGCANDDREHYAYAKTLPEAICIAALRAHGVEVD